MNADNLKRLHEVVKRLEGTSSTKEKVGILTESLVDTEVSMLFRLVYDEDITFGITSSFVSGGSSGSIPCPLGDFAERKLTGQKAKNAWASFLSGIPPELHELANRVLDKDLKCRTGLTLVNRAFLSLGLEPVARFNVALADTFEDDAIFDGSDWYASRKMDGVRCLCVIDDTGKVSLYSRKGKPFISLSAVEYAVSHLGLKEVVLDGEVSLRTENGGDDFQGIMKVIKKKGFTIPDPVFHIFDMLTPDEFYNKTGEAFSVRQKRLDSLDFSATGVLRRVEQTPCNDMDTLNALVDKSREYKWEGLILRKDAPYKGKRSKDMLKVKDFYDDEFVVKGTVNGTMNIIENGKEKAIECMSSAVVEYKGGEVFVGSGWSMEDRQRYYKNPEEIIGKCITVKYFEETKNQDGGLSLRFPTVKCVHGKTREA